MPTHPAHRVQGTLPEPRGPLSAHAIGALRGVHTGDTPEVYVVDPVGDDDLQLALYVLYELHYRGFDGVDDELEWDTDLLAFRRTLEQALLRQLRDETAVDERQFGVVTELQRLAADDSGPSLSSHLQRQADAGQFAEFLAHRSVYQLKEADPHTWAVPRLAGRSKLALLEIQADEYGQGRLDRMHSELFARTLRELGLEAGYGHYVDDVPGVTLALGNVMSLFGLHRAWRGALVGQLALYEMTSSSPCRHYAQGLRRLGASDAACAFYDEHVTADALHEQLAMHDLCASLAADEPGLGPQIVFGARVNALLERRFAEHVLDAWSRGESSLRSASVHNGRLAVSA